MCHAPVCLISLRPSLRTLRVSLPSSTSSSCSFTSSCMGIGSELNPLCASANEESGPLVNNAPLTGYEPNFFDDYHYSETTEIFFQVSSSDTRPSCLHDSEISDDTIDRALSSPLFTQEREEPAAAAYHSLEESLLSSQSLSVGHVRTVRLVNKLSSLSSSVRENPRRDSENDQIRILLERQKEQILADCRAEIQKHEFQADYDRTSIQKLNGVIESQRGEINRALEGEINNFFMNNYWNNIGNFVKLMREVSMRWKNGINFKALLSLQLRGEHWSNIETLSLN